MNQYKTISNVCLRRTPSIKAGVSLKVKKGQIIQIDLDTIKIKTEKKLQKKITKVWVKATYLGETGWIRWDKIKPCGDVNYLKLAAIFADTVYKCGIGCKHQNCKKLADIEKRNVINCSGYASVVYQLAGILPTGKVVSHRPATSNAVKRKNTIEKAMSGSNFVPKQKCKIVHVGKKYKDMPKSLKKKGIMYIQDSNNCINAGNGYIYSFNNAASEMKNGRYVKAKVKSGYPFTSPILYALIPQ